MSSDLPPPYGSSELLVQVLKATSLKEIIFGKICPSKSFLLALDFFIEVLLQWELVCAKEAPRWGSFCSSSPLCSNLSDHPFKARLKDQMGSGSDHGSQGINSSSQHIIGTQCKPEKHSRAHYSSQVPVINIDFFQWEIFIRRHHMTYIH